MLMIVYRLLLAVGREVKNFVAMGTSVKEQYPEHLWYVTKKECLCKLHIAVFEGGSACNITDIAVNMYVSEGQWKEFQIALSQKNVCLTIVA